MPLAPQRARQWSGLISEDIGVLFFKLGIFIEELYLAQQTERRAHGFICDNREMRHCAPLAHGAYRHETTPPQIHDQG